MGQESKVKTAMVKSVRSAGGYARRIEDQFGVGILDTILVPRSLPVFFAEVKVVRDNVFGPTDRQWVEMTRVSAALSLHAIPIIIGWKNGVYYFHEAAPSVDIRQCFSVTNAEMNFNDQLVQFYHGRILK